MIPVLLAVPDRSDEPQLVRGAAASGLRVVRRCMDATELLAAATAEPDVAVVLSPALPRLTAGLLEQVGRGRLVVGLVASGEDRELMAGAGVATVLADAADPARTMRAIAHVIAERQERDATGHRAEPPAGESAEAGGHGRVVAVWGPQGAPGRTTVAIGLADALARRGLRTCLVDVDTFAPSVALALGVVHEGGGLPAACRLADLGTLDGRSLDPLLAPVGRNLRLLGGLSGSDRWSDLRPGAVEQVLSALRSLVDVIVVDVGFCLEPAEETAWARPRNAAERLALGMADEVIAVADASAAGAARLARQWADLTSTGSGHVRIVRNRSGGRARQGQPSHRAWIAGIRTLGVLAPVEELPDDRGAVARAWRHGQTLGEGAPRSRLCHALERLALHVVAG